MQAPALLSSHLGTKYLMVPFSTQEAKLSTPFEASVGHLDLISPVFLPQKGSLQLSSGTVEYSVRNRRSKFPLLRPEDQLTG